MASLDEKLDADTKRMKTRNFAGYLKDRVTGSADFDKEDKAKTSKAAVMGLGDAKTKADAEAAGFKKGGMVKGKTVKKPTGSCW
jgi:hypothetical protein